MLARILCICLLLTGFTAFSTRLTAAVAPDDYKEYTDYFEKVYRIFQDHYYLPPDRKIYDHFLEKFKTKIYSQLKGEGKSNDYVRWRSAWFLVDALKSKDDKFTGFWPPKPAKQFEHDVMAQTVDLGIEGRKNDIGFLVTRMEPHSDAYAQGLREDDVILKIDGKGLKKLSQKEIEAKLTPVVNTRVAIAYLSAQTRMPKAIQAVSKEYFKQTVFFHQVPVHGVFCLEVRHFNEMTAPEFGQYMQMIESQNPKGLVLDMRGNPGGQIGGAMEMSAFFLPKGQQLAYFQKRNSPKDEIDVPDLGPKFSQFQFNGPVVILVDDGTGSAAELFSGVMQFLGRAVVLGVNTAGQILLKNIFPVGDGSTIGLVVARGYYPDGHVFGFDGITPNKVITDAPKEGLIDLAAALIAQARP